MAPAVVVEGVSKKFRRGEQFDSLRDLLAERILRRRERDQLKSAEFWALRDVSLRLEPGEACGVIGPNGAGKSTLLKILAGIMRPNRGRVAIRGRVSALIELGAGFHGDLTGRENIYLNASILGLPRAEVRRRFDEIVEFAGVGEFLDTPIKRYSSGMHARLGFAIAVHADPQVLLVDEVLSVGDRVFRFRCMDKMQEFLKQGVAVVFVSHDLSAVSRFCHRAMVLDRGETLFCGSGAAAVGHYYHACVDRHLISRSADHPLVEVSPLRLIDRHGREATILTPGQRLGIEFDVRFAMHLPNPSFGLSLIRSEDRTVVFETSSTRMGHSTPTVQPGDRCAVRYDLDLNVPPGEYLLGYHVRDRDAAQYAMFREDTRLMVVGPVNSGGTAYLAPRVSVRVSPGEPLEPLWRDPAANDPGEVPHDDRVGHRCRV